MLIIDPEKLKKQMDKIVRKVDVQTGRVYRRPNSSVEELAHALGTTKQHIENILRGYKRNNEKVEAKVSHTLGTVEQLMVELGCDRFEQLLSWTHIDTLADAPQAAPEKYENDPGDKKPPGGKRKDEE